MNWSKGMKRRDFLKTSAGLAGALAFAPNMVFASDAPQKPKEIIVRAWGGAWGDALKPRSSVNYLQLLQEKTRNPLNISVL